MMVRDPVIGESSRDTYAISYKSCREAQILMLKAYLANYLDHPVFVFYNVGYSRVIFASSYLTDFLYIKAKLEINIVIF